MQGGRLVVPTPGVVIADEVGSPAVPTELAGLVESGAEPAVAVLRPEVDAGDAVVEPIVEPGPLMVDVVPIDPLVALPIVLDEPGALVPGDDRELPLSPVPELNVVVEPGDVVVPDSEPGLAVPGTLVLAPGMLVVAPGTPTRAPGTEEVIGALDIAVPSVPVVGTHGRDEIGCPVGFVVSTGGFAGPEPAVGLVGLAGAPAGGGFD